MRRVLTIVGDDHGGCPERIDDAADTWVTVGCYRETWRLDRALLVYHKVLSLALSRGMLEFARDNIDSIFDRKGSLTVTYHCHPEDRDLYKMVEAAWEDVGEDPSSISHEQIYFQIPEVPIAMGGRDE